MSARRLSAYLAGPISGCSYEGATEWREEVKRKLAGKVDCYSPMRHKEFLKDESNIAMMYHDKIDVMSTSKGIMTRDYNDCINANVLLVYLAGTTKVSAGTVMELAWAFHKRIPTVVVCEPDNIHLQHPMILESVSYRVDSLCHGIALVQSILLP
jgi:nucleoside 2-deoxyribosyltransferase